MYPLSHERAQVKTFIVISHQNDDLEFWLQKKENIPLFLSRKILSTIVLIKVDRSSSLDGVHFLSDNMGYTLLARNILWRNAVISNKKRFMKSTYIIKTILFRLKRLLLAEFANNQEVEYGFQWMIFQNMLSIN